jgi:hypothetical protein
MSYSSEQADSRLAERADRTASVASENRKEVQMPLSFTQVKRVIKPTTSKVDLTTSKIGQ